MAIEFNGTTIETNPQGYLENTGDWSEDLARHMAAAENIELTDKHWDVINYLRSEYFDNRETQPNTRTIFPIEIEIDNQDARIPAGMSAEVQLPLSEVLAVKITARDIPGFRSKNFT